MKRAIELDLASILMKTNVNKFQDVEAYWHFIAYKFLLAQAGMQYKQDHVASQ